MGHLLMRLGMEVRGVRVMRGVRGVLSLGCVPGGGGLAVVRDKSLVRGLSLVMVIGREGLALEVGRHLRGQGRGRVLGERGVGPGVGGDVLGVVQEDGLGALWGAQHTLQVLDVLHGLVQDPHLGNLLDGRGGGHVLPKRLKAVVDRLDPPPLPLISLDSFQVLRWFNFVSMNWVEGHKFGFWCHDFVTNLLCSQMFTL